MIVEGRNKLRATRGRSWGEVREMNKKKWKKKRDK